MLGKNNTGNLYHRYSNETSCLSNLMSESRTVTKQNKELESSTSYFLKGSYCNVLWAKFKHSKNTRSFTELLWPDFGIKNDCETIHAHSWQRMPEFNWKNLYGKHCMLSQKGRYRSTIGNICCTVVLCKKSRTGHPTPSLSFSSLYHP